MRFAFYLESFSDVARRIELVPRLITAQEWLLDGDDPHEVVDLLRDLEREVLKAIEQNGELEEAA
jgi:hypothetical protein